MKVKELVNVIKGLENRCFVDSFYMGPELQVVLSINYCAEDLASYLDIWVIGYGRYRRQDGKRWIPIYHGRRHGFYVRKRVCNPRLGWLWEGIVLLLICFFLFGRFIKLMHMEETFQKNWVKAVYQSPLPYRRNFSATPQYNRSFTRRL